MNNFRGGIIWSIGAQNFARTYGYRPGYVEAVVRAPQAAVDKGHRTYVVHGYGLCVSVTLSRTGASMTINGFTEDSRVTLADAA